MSQGVNSLVEPNGSAGVEVARPDPDFIVYLLDPKQEYNCYFLVGNPDLGDTERIGVVKKMLIAHSLVLRAQLQDSKIAEKNYVKVIDIFPQTFKNLLRFVYGHDNTGELSFEELDNLLYVAERYLMPKLKKRISTHLIPMLNCDNICSLMNNLACYSELEIHSQISYILQTETYKVLASPQFFDLSPYAFFKILEQEVSAVPEIDLWRAAIKWAMNRGESENGEVLRNQLNDHLKQIRICSLPEEYIITEVIPSKVLTYDELILVCKSYQTGEVQQDLTTICNVIEERERPLVKSELLTLSIENGGHYNNIRESTLKLNTKEAAIELCSVRLSTGNLSAHQCDCTISLQEGTEPLIVSRYQGPVNSASNWTIPILVNEKSVELCPNSSYTIKFTFSCSFNHNVMYATSLSNNFLSVDMYYYNGYYTSHVSGIDFKTITKILKPVQARG